LYSGFARITTVSRYSSKNLPVLALAPRFTEKAAKFLADFANTHPDGLDRFARKWTDRLGATGWWNERVQDIAKAQQTVRAVWEGKSQGDQAVSVGLGLIAPRQDYRQEYDAGYIDTSMVLFHVNWEGGYIWARPRDMNDYVWLSLLHCSKQLAICANREGGCPTPYFIRIKANQKFCSDECAAPAQRAFKQQWWSEHGEEWRQQRLKLKSRKQSARKKMSRQ